MAKAPELASQFANSSLSRARVRAFANHVSKVEADEGVEIKRALINGIPPFENVPAVEFDVPRAKLGRIVDKLLSDPKLNPNIMIDGIPSVDVLRLRVIGR
jgi:hypothetical protein